MQKLLCNLIFLGTVLGAPPTVAQTKPTKEVSNRNVNLAIEIPVPNDKFTYRITGSVDGVEYYKDKVPLISFENSEKWLQQVGDLAVGTPFKMDKVTAFRGRHYFGVEKKTMQGGKELTTIVWVDGLFVEISGVNSTSDSTTAK